MPPLSAHSTESADPWDQHSQSFITWHGCTRVDRERIQDQGIDLKFGRRHLDFGRGFYTTPSRQQAERWAKVRHIDLSESSEPEVVAFRIPRLEFVHLKLLTFMTYEVSDRALRSFVDYCRQDPSHNHQGPRDGWYDVVLGPSSPPWLQLGQGSPTNRPTKVFQLSFHTPEAIALLNDLIRSGIPVILTGTRFPSANAKTHAPEIRRPMARPHTTEYWNDVQEHLMTDHGLPRRDAAGAIREYCERLGALGVADEIYHRSPSDTAVVIQERTARTSG